MTDNLIQEADIFGGNRSHPGLGLGLESEQVQRVVKAQIMKFLPHFTEKLQAIWDERDKEYAEETETAFSQVIIPEVRKENFYTGVKPSLVEAPIIQWPSITVYCHDAKPSQLFQADQYDTYELPLCIDTLCCIGPVPQVELREQLGIETEQILDSQLQRLSDAIYLCIKHDPTFGGVLSGEYGKPPNFTQSLPWSRQESIGKGDWYIFQGKLQEYSVQKASY